MKSQKLRSTNEMARKIKWLQVFIEANGDATEAQMFLGLDLQTACNYILYKQKISDPDTVFSLAMQNEAFYFAIFELLPLENINPRDLLKFIPKNDFQH